MVNTGEQLKKYKAIRDKLKKTFPKGAGYTGFTIDICYGGNKEPDIKRVSLGGASSDPKINQEFLTIVTQAVEDNIDFWQKAVRRDIKQLEESLNQ
tara:strand:+ start:687 stop:974 length:288 start_codon:yes stop_codon:yes gene_type:complete